MAVMKMVALTMIGPQSEMEPVARQMISDLASGATAMHAAGIRKN